jgi:nucleoside-diphosphate-sugar epimerase
VVGADGYVGSALVAHLQRARVPCRAVGRRGRTPTRGDLGHVVYCAGVTSDARERPLDAMDAHVCGVNGLLRRGGFRSLLYLSSTRVYAGAASGREDAVLEARPDDPGELFALSKLAGEAACLAVERSEVRVVRLATVYGGTFASPNFLCELLRAMDARDDLAVTAAPETARDYVHVDDVAAALSRIAQEGARRVYNLASGEAVRNDRLVAELGPRLSCRVRLEGTAPAPAVPHISIDRLREDLGFEPRPLLAHIDDVVAEFQRAR